MLEWSLHEAVCQTWESNEEMQSWCSGFYKQDRGPDSSEALEALQDLLAVGTVGCHLCVLQWQWVVPCENAWRSPFRYTKYEEVEAAVICAQQRNHIDDSDRSEAWQQPHQENGGTQDETPVPALGIYDKTSWHCQGYYEEDQTSLALEWAWSSRHHDWHNSQDKCKCSGSEK